MDSTVDAASGGQCSFLLEPNQHIHAKRREVSIPTMMECLTTELLSKRTASSSSWLSPRVDDCRDYVDMVLTCEGDYYDPEFPLKLKCFNQKLLQILHADKEKLTIKKVEPWNSVKVTLNIPREAAVRLKALAEEGSEALRNIGVLAVQVEGDRVISMTFMGREDQTTHVRFGSAPCHGTDHLLPAMSSPTVQQKSPVTTLLSGHFLKPKPVEMPVATVRSNGGIEHPQAFSNGIPFACHPTLAPKLGAASTAVLRQSGHTVAAAGISGTLSAVTGATVASVSRGTLSCSVRQPVGTKNTVPKAKRIRKKEPALSCKPPMTAEVPLSSANAEIKVIDRTEMPEDGSNLTPPCTARLAPHAGSSGSDGVPNVTLVPVGCSQNGCTQHTNRSLLEPGKCELVSANESIKAINDIITSLSASPSHHVLVHHQTSRVGVNKSSNVHSTSHTILSSVTTSAASVQPCSSRSQASAIVKDSAARLGGSNDTLNGHGSGTAGSGEVVSRVDVTVAGHEAEKAMFFTSDVGSGAKRNSNTGSVCQRPHASSAAEGICVAVAMQPDNKTVAVSLSHVPHMTTNKLLVHSDKLGAGVAVVRSIDCSTSKSARLLANCAMQAAVSSHPGGLATSIAGTVSSSGAASPESLPSCLDATAAAAADVQQAWPAHTAIGDSRLMQAFHHDVAWERPSCDTRFAPVTVAVRGHNQSLLVKRNSQLEQHAQLKPMVNLVAASSTATVTTPSTSATVAVPVDSKPDQTIKLPAEKSSVETKAVACPVHPSDHSHCGAEVSEAVASSNDDHSSPSAVGVVGLSEVLPLVESVAAAPASPETHAPQCSTTNCEDDHIQRSCPFETEVPGVWSSPPVHLPLRHSGLKIQLDSDQPAANADLHSHTCEQVSLQTPLSPAAQTPMDNDQAALAAATRCSSSDGGSHVQAAKLRRPLPEQNQFCGHAASTYEIAISGTSDPPDPVALQVSPTVDVRPVTLPGGQLHENCFYAINSPAMSSGQCHRVRSSNEDNGQLEVSPSDASITLRMTPVACSDQDAPLDLSSPTRSAVQSSQLFDTTRNSDKNCIRVNGLTCSESEVATSLVPKLEDEHDSSIACSSCTTNGAVSSPEREAHGLSNACLQLPANSADARRASSESIESGISLDECSSEMAATAELGNGSPLSRSVAEHRGDGVESGDGAVERIDCSAVLLAAQSPASVAVDRPLQRSAPGRGRPRGGTKRSYLLTIESNSTEDLLRDMEASRLGIGETDGEPKAKGRRGRKVQECPKNGILLTSMSAALLEPAKRSTRSHGAADLQALPTVYRERRKPLLKDKK